MDSFLYRINSSAMFAKQPVSPCTGPRVSLLTRSLLLHTTPSASTTSSAKSEYTCNVDLPVSIYSRQSITISIPPLEYSGAQILTYLVWILGGTILPDYELSMISNAYCITTEDGVELSDGESVDSLGISQLYMTLKLSGSENPLQRLHIHPSAIIVLPDGIIPMKQLVHSIPSESSNNKWLDQVAQCVRNQSAALKTLLNSNFKTDDRVRALQKYSNDKGNSLLDIAVSFGDKNTVKLLLQYGVTW